MLVLVTFVGWVVVRFAATYMDGEARTGRLHRLALCDAGGRDAAGDRGQHAATGAGLDPDERFLHKLLLFYPERVAAQRAARKKWVTARRVTRR
jgi:NAD(P)H-quinone oxidoreductase subunit 5